ncbi:28243_t:CDS:2, partial [Dentiscutata erythropus]
CKSKFVNPRTKEQHSLTTSQQLSQTDLNEIRQPALSKELKRDDNELLPSLDIDNLSFLPKKRQQTSSAKINILNAKEQVITSADEKELAKDIRYSNINEFENYLAPNIDYENESQPRLRILSSFDDILIWLLKFQSA